MKRGDIVAEVDTEKGVIDVEIFTDGVIERLLAQPGETVPVGTPLAIVQDANAPPEADHQAARMAPQPPAATSAGGTTTPTASPPIDAQGSAAAPPRGAASTGRLRISPAARNLAQKLKVDPSQVQGTGDGGAITRDDIERAAAASGQTIAASQKMDESITSTVYATGEAADTTRRMRQAIAAAMGRSKREIPHYYLSTTIDLHAALTWLAAENEKRPVTERILYGTLLLKSVALAIKEVPELNAFWADDYLAMRDEVHLGVAISLRKGGLIAPAIHNADRLGLGELMQKFRELVNRARAGGLRSSELSDPTITVTSLGEQGVEAVYPIIYPPQVAIVGFGKVVERPWVVDGQVVARPVITATLAADHRVSDGHRGGLFLAAVDRLLQEPSKL